MYLEIKPPADLAYFARGGPTLPPSRKPSAAGGYVAPLAGYICIVRIVTFREVEGGAA